MNRLHKTPGRGDGFRVSSLSLPALLALLLACGPLPALAQVVTVALSGRVVDGGGTGVAGATVKLLETSLSTTTGADGAFALEGTFQVGLVRRATAPGGGRLEYRQGRLLLVPGGSRPLRATLVAPGGRMLPLSHGLGEATYASGKPIDLDTRLGATAGTWFLRLEDGTETRTYRLVRGATRSGTLLFAGPAAVRRTPGAPRAKTAADSADLILEVTATGHLGKRFFQGSPTRAGLTLALLPAAATHKERIQDFLGEGRSFRVAYLRKESAGSRKLILHYRDFAGMAGDTLPSHAFADSRGPSPNPEVTPFGANVPAWSPDGSVLAYEIGTENQTVNNVSRIYLQPLQGARKEGPAFPATNPRWWTDGKEHWLLWCTSGREDGYRDTASRTFRQKVVDGALAGQPEEIAKGSWHGGLSADGRYLASAFKHGVMLDRETGLHRHFHVYPGRPPAPDGSPTDSLQVCNPSVSPDPARPSRMLFLDFGVPPGDQPYPNRVRPQHYAQHRMILVGDYRSEAPGRIVDFIDTPAEELAKGRTWDDPEWSNHPDFAVATTRDPKGDLSNPDEPRPTQPDIYLIHLPTKSALKVVSGDHHLLPALWVGPRP